MGPIIGIVGGSGGVGASGFAAVVASAAGESLLLDLDVSGGGIDVVLGVEAATGARWSGVRLAGGHLDAATLLDGLPRWGRCAVLAADVAALDPDDVAQVIDVAAVCVPVVLDLPRAAGPERVVALRRCDLAVVVARADVTGLVAAHAVASGLGDVPLGVVVRRGEVPAVDAARLVGGRLLGELPSIGRRSVLDTGRRPRAAAQVASGVLVGALVGARTGAVAS
jgi:hypothetical protein